MTVSIDLRQVVESALNRSRVKGMAVAIARGDGDAECLCVGSDTTGRPVETDSLFPVASVTKLATALAVLRLVDRGSLSPDDPLAYHVPEATAAAHLGVTFRRMLSHTSGLPLDLPDEEVLYQEGLDWPALALACLRTPLQRAPNSRVQYSNVGYGLLAVAVERLTGERFSDALNSLVLEPLGIEGYLGVQPPRRPLTLGGVTGSSAHTPLEPFNSDFWRSLAMPWAGLVTTAEGALALVRAFTGFPSGFLRPETRAEATRNQAGDLPGGFTKPLMWRRSPWGLGPELRDEKSPHWAPPEASPNSFGHSGASGCIAWADPEAGVAWAILGTRVAASGWLVTQGPRIGAAILGRS